jgi:hypothetical protein
MLTFTHALTYTQRDTKKDTTQEYVKISDMEAKSHSKVAQKVSGGGEEQRLTLGVLLPGHLEELTDVSGLLRLQRERASVRTSSRYGKGVRRRAGERDYHGEAEKKLVPRSRKVDHETLENTRRALQSTLKHFR